MLLSFTGCKDETEEAWKVAYRANYERAYQGASETGKARGKAEGEKQGAEAARAAAKTGRAWQLYTPLVCWAVVPGVLVGIFVQYAILFTCQVNGRLPRPATFAFVPALKRSLCYSIFERRFRLMVEFDEQLEKVLAARNLKIAQVQAVHDAVKRRVMAASSIEELTEARASSSSPTPNLQKSSQKQREPIKFRTSSNLRHNARIMSAHALIAESESNFQAKPRVQPSSVHIRTVVIQSRCRRYNRIKMES